METLLAAPASEHALIALFLTAFLAATLLPLGSEWLVVLLITQHHPLVTVVWVATLGNTLGGATNYLIGWAGQRWWRNRPHPPRQKARLDQAQALMKRYGGAALLFSWLPVIGDPLCVVAGVLRYPLVAFFVLVAVGKFGRYVFLAWATQQAMGLA
ncbi:YqaA family protein [Geoalkalibacter halelectricus]|uniref:DedA family protein n=1 Tax=Geoalkalibacter halelectricus TaxID=2847045 RepID=A0ABY5ZI44_9BACT|nr:YqaA family protein [Geoalkalibacter halelectricus]MDO3379008.1 DedA family protein [Geoalkalibacter halelectricus]UWZ78822.1 DedA family protein [Geoalkalibacter halelectricus]